MTHTKVTYQTNKGKTFRTIVPVKPYYNSVEVYMYDHYLMSEISILSIRPTVKTGYRKVVNKEVIQ